MGCPWPENGSPRVPGDFFSEKGLPSDMAVQMIGVLGPERQRTTLVQVMAGAGTMWLGCMKWSGVGWGGVYEVEWGGVERSGVEWSGAKWHGLRRL